MTDVRICISRKEMSRRLLSSQRTMRTCRRTSPCDDLILTNTTRRFSDWNLRIRAGLEQGHKRFFNRNGS